MRSITEGQRRALLSRRHHLSGDAAGPEAVTRALVALHATDPASVYLSVLARSSVSTLADVAEAMYERRTLVRWLCVRRTLFLVPYEDVPGMQAAVSGKVADALRTRLVNQIARNGTAPPVEGDAATWVDSLAERVERALQRRGSAGGRQLSDDEPALRTTILPRAPSDRPHMVTSSLLTMLGAQGRIVRGTPTGAWTSRHHHWEHVRRWWPQGLSAPDPGVAERELARRWLSRFGPATVEDLRWWTGWSRTTVRRALSGLPLEDIDLHGTPGIHLTGAELDLPDLADEVADASAQPPVAALLPALDSTAMGWRSRDWYLAVDPAAVFDRAGNIGPTVWWDGEVVGSWATTARGEIRTACLVDRGERAVEAIAAAASRLQSRLGGSAVTPAVRTPLEQSLTERS